MWKCPSGWINQQLQCVDNASNNPSLVKVQTQGYINKDYQPIIMITFSQAVDYSMVAEAGGGSLQDHITVTYATDDQIKGGDNDQIKVGSNDQIKGRNRLLQ